MGDWPPVIYDDSAGRQLEIKDVYSAADLTTGSPEAEVDEQPLQRRGGCVVLQ